MRTTRTGNKVVSDTSLDDPQPMTLAELFAVLRKKAEWLRGVGDGLDNVRILQESVSIRKLLNDYEKLNPEEFK